MVTDPFEILVDIERKCRAHAKPLPQQKAVGKVWQGIGFVASDMNFVSPLDEIIEVIPVPVLTNMPSSVEWFRGVTNLRGGLLPVTDLEGFVLGTPSTLSPSSRILVVAFENTGVGFLVSEVLGVERFLQSNIKKGAGEKPTKFEEYIQGIVSEDTESWNIMSLKALSQTAQFYHVIKGMGA